MLNHLINKPATINEQTSLLIMLHGYGSNKEDLFSLAPALPKDLLVIAAEAPIELGGNAFAWYSIEFDENGLKSYSYQEAKQAIENINEFITQMQQTYSIKPEKTILMGFSQGCILSIATSLTYPEKVQKVAGLSGFADQKLLPASLDSEKLENHDFFISHGTQDIILPIELARATDEFLKELGVNYEYKEYQAGHTISVDNLNDLNSWIKDRI